MNPLLARLQRALENRYSVEHELGRGGMATVFLGHDQRHERRVAIKVFEKEGGLITGAERFLREIKVAARLQHPNILPVFDSGEGEGLVYYVMPYVAGGSVRERLEREGPLPVPDAVRIAREVAEALDHAHRAGIVHRDIKPDNIMLADGVAVVADFGIARAIEQSGGSVTDTGLAIGTPNYMSPEQASASPQIDGRTDIYALGCVLYEMLAGTPPFSGPTAQAVMARHATDAAPPLSTIRQIPAGLEQAVTKSLAKLPGDRWPTGRALADALAATSGSQPPPTMPRRRRVALWLSLSALASLAVFLLIWKWPSSRPSGTPADSTPAIGILPFVLIGDSSNAHIAAGLTEALITGLVDIGGVRVPAQSTVARYQGLDQDPVAIGRELQVEHVVTANVQIVGPTLRIQPRMIRVSDGSVAWTMRLDGDMSNVFAMYDTMSQRIISELRVRLTPESRAVLSRGVGTNNQEAYNLYALGRSLFLRHDPTSLRRAAEYFKQASALDESYAAPLVGLLDTYDLLENVDPGAYQITGAPPAALLRRVLALEPGNGVAHSYLAIQRWRACDTTAALAGMQAAVRFSPGSALLRREYAIFLMGLGRRDEALAMSREAARIDPSSPWVLSVLSYAHAAMGNYDSATVIAERTLSLDSTLWVPNVVRGLAAALAGRADEGVRFLEAARRLGGAAHGMATASLGWAYGRAGMRQQALDIAQLLSDRVERGEATRIQVAGVYVGLGDFETAFRWLERPPQATDYRAADNLWDPMFDAIRSDPRVPELSGRRFCHTAS